MGILFYIIGAILKTHPPSANPNLADSSPPPASQAMAAMLYIYVCFYSMGWGNETSFNIDQVWYYQLIILSIGPLPWVYVSDIFPTQTRHYGLSLASASQWLWSTLHYGICMYCLALQTTFTNRFRHQQSNTDFGHFVRIQVVPYVCDNWHWRIGCVFIVRTHRTPTLLQKFKSSHHKII